MGAICCTATPGGELDGNFPDEPIDVIPITVAVVAAQGLRLSDWLPSSTRTSNCYCAVTAQRKGSAARDLCRTMPSMSNLEPVWKQEMQLYNVSALDVLEFTIYEEDADGNSQRLGKASVASTQVNNGFAGELPLTGGPRGTKPFLYLKTKGTREYYPHVYSEVVVSVSRAAEDESWGLDLDCQDATVLWVNGVKPGPVENYNKLTDPEEHLQSGDFIVQANGIHSSVDKMLATFQDERTVAMLVKRPVEIRAIIERDGSTAGLEFLANPTGHCLLIRQVNSGPAQKWNESQSEPSAQLRPGDRIVAVNGQRGRAADLQRLLAAPGRCQVLALRVADSNHWRFW